MPKKQPNKLSSKLRQKKLPLKKPAPLNVHVLLKKPKPMSVPKLKSNAPKLRLMQLLQRQGMSSAQLRPLLNRADESGGLEAGAIDKALPVPVAHRVANDPTAVQACVHLGIPLHEQAPGSPVLRDLRLIASQSLGLPLAQARLWLVAAMALATAAAVAQMGLIAFVGLAAPHAVRSLLRCTHAGLLWLSALMGGTLLLLADVLARWLLAPQDLPVGVLTAVLGGFYLLWRMKPAAGGRA